MQKFIGYSRDKTYSQDQRRVMLREVFYAGPFMPSANNRRYVEAFGPPATKHRAEFLLQMLNRSMLSESGYLRDPGHIRHASALKLRDDIAWLQSEIKAASWT